MRLDKGRNRSNEKAIAHGNFRWRISYPSQLHGDIGCRPSFNGQTFPLPVHGWRDQDRGGRGKRDTGDRILGERRNSIGFLFLSPLPLLLRSRYQMQIQLQLPSFATSHHIRGRKERRNEDILHILYPHFIHNTQCGVSPISVCLLLFYAMCDVSLISICLLLF